MNTIILTTRGIECFEAPEDFRVDDQNSEWYKTTGGYMSPFVWKEKKLEAAMKQSVLFNPDDNNVYAVMEHTLESAMEKGKLYPVPDGYEIKVKKEVMSIGDPNRWVEVNNNWLEDTYNKNADYAKRKYAVLVPKQVHKTCNEWPDCDCGQLEKDNCTKELVLVPKQEPIDLTKNPELLHSYEQLHPKQPTSIDKEKQKQILIDLMNDAPTSIEEAMLEFIKERHLAKGIPQDQYAVHYLNGYLHGLKEGFIEGVNTKTKNK